MVETYPQALTIAGSDSGGGAGIQADLKTFQERLVFGTSAITAVTSQNTQGVQASYTLPKDVLISQLTSIFADFDIRAVKTGMLADTETMQAVVQFAQQQSLPQLVIDPVMIAKGGASLLAANSIQTLKEQLVPLATVLTPNLPEAEVLVDEKLPTQSAIQKAAQKLQALGAKNVVIKGGHRLDTEVAEDFVLLENGKSFWLSSVKTETVRTHGTGCTFSACIAAELAKQADVEAAIRTAKAFITASIEQSIEVGHGHGPVNHWAYRKEE